MKIMRFLSPEGGPERVGEVDGQVVYAYPAGTDLLEALLKKQHAPRTEGIYRLNVVRPLCPYKPSLIYGIGLNYPSHPLQKTCGQVEKPAVPVIFLKGPNAAAGSTDEIPIPTPVKQLDYEGELALIIGHDGRVAAYTVANDLTSRDLQKSERQWSRAKGFDRSCPFGPWLTSVDEISDPTQLEVITHVNGELRQQAHVSEMIFSIDEMISAISETNTLRAGDLVLTGSPTGTGISFVPPVFLKPGDTVRVEIGPLGHIENRITETL